MVGEGGLAILDLKSGLQKLYVRIYLAVKLHVLLPYLGSAIHDKGEMQHKMNASRTQLQTHSPLIDASQARSPPNRFI